MTWRPDRWARAVCVRSHRPADFDRQSIHAWWPVRGRLLAACKRYGVDAPMPDDRRPGPRTDHDIGYCLPCINEYVRRYAAMRP